MSGMRPLEKLISLEKALAIVAKVSKPTERKEIVPIWSAAGRVLASDIRAEMEVPPFNRSAMDGFAVRAFDIKSASRSRPTILKIAEKIFAGDVPKKRIGSHQCAEIATGGMLPKGADTIVMVEDSVRRRGQSVAILSAVREGTHAILAGDDIKKGAMVARKGDLLSPAKIGSIAAVGIDKITAYAHPNAVVMPTGDEVVRPGMRLKPGQIYDVNTFTLKSAIQSFGGNVDIRRIVEDSKKSLIDAISADKDADIIIFSGGSSVGEKDLIVDAVSELGEVLFHGVAIRPGKPTLLGKVGKSIVLGMPGHPTSCLSNAYIFLEPMIAKIGRYPAKGRTKVKARLSMDVRLSMGRTTVLTVKLSGGQAVPAFKESSAITSMAHADGYIMISPEKEILKKGTVVTVILF